MVSLELEVIWRHPSLSELTPMISRMELIHSGLEASICEMDEGFYKLKKKFKFFPSYIKTLRKNKSRKVVPSEPYINKSKFSTYLNIYV